MRLLLIDIDSLRPDHLGCYGYPRRTSPNIDAIAAEGTLFENCSVSDSPCAPSRTAFATGMYGTRSGVVAHAGPAYQPHVPMRPYSMLRRLRQEGVRTATISSFADRHEAWWYCAGWEEVHTHTLRCGNEDAHEVNEAAVRWLRGNARTDDWLLHVQYWDPHTYYTEPEPWATRFIDDPLPDHVTPEEFGKHLHMATPHSPTFLDYVERHPYPSPYFPTGRLETFDDYRAWIAAYDGAIAYADEHVGHLVEILQEAGVWDDTVVVVTADHGEQQGDRSAYGEHLGVYEATQRVPLIVRAPGRMPAHAHRPELVSHLDIIPTISELFGVAPHPAWDGRTLFDLLDDRGEPWRDHLVTTHGLWTAQRGVRTADWAYVRTYHPGFFLQYGPVELFDMCTDQAQRHDVSAQHPDVVGAMESLLADWLSAVLSSRPRAPVDPLQHVIRHGPYLFDPAGWVKRLEEAGHHTEAQRNRTLAGLGPR